MNLNADGTTTHVKPESAVRKLRAAIYGEISDEAWAKVRRNWLISENVKWLEAQPQNQPPPTLQRP